MTVSSPPTISVCLLNYNGRPYLDRCVAALRRLDPAPVDVVAVDNASPDGSVDRLRAFAAEAGPFPIRVIASATNRGYAGGHNLGASASRGEFLAFLNVTVEPQPGWLRVVEWLVEHPDVAFAQPATFHADDPDRLESLGSLLDPAGRLTVVGRNRRETRDAGAPYVAPVLSVLGAAFVARRSAFERLGGFDERFFMYFEETDLCWRAWLRGLSSVCWFDPAAPTRVYHRVHGTHPRGFDVARYFEPNRTLTLVKNLERANLWHVASNVATVAAESARRPGRFLRYLGEVARRMPETVRDRRRIQSERTVADAQLFALRPPKDLGRWFVP